MVYDVEKITVLFKFREFRILYICLLYISTISAILDCQFVFDRQKGKSCFGALFVFLQFVKNQIKCARRLEMLTMAFGKSIMSRTQVQLCVV